MWRATSICPGSPPAWSQAAEWTTSAPVSSRLPLLLCHRVPVWMRRGAARRGAGGFGVDVVPPLPASCRGRGGGGLSLLSSLSACLSLSPCPLREPATRAGRSAPTSERKARRKKKKEPGEISSRCRNVAKRFDQRVGAFVQQFKFRGPREAAGSSPPKCRGSPGVGFFFGVAELQLRSDGSGF